MDQQRTIVTETEVDHGKEEKKDVCFHLAEDVLGGTDC